MLNAFYYFSIMKITIRKGIKSDLPDVLQLIKELADYENAKDQVTITLNDLEKDGFSKQPLFWFLVAVNKKEIIVFNKVDLIGKSDLNDKIQIFERKIKKKVIILSNTEKKLISKLKSNLLAYVSK